MINLSISPLEVTLIVTNQCTASCKNCCFQCNPQNKDRLSLPEMKQHIDNALDSYSTIKLLIITGGECFILGEELNDIVKYASDRNLYVRVVTNGYWATTLENAYYKLEKLVEVGLKEINFSTGDEHQVFVPYNNIVFGIISALKLNIMVAVNIELSNNSIFDMNFIKNDIRLEKYKDRIGKDLVLIYGKWMPFLKSEDNKMESKDNTYKHILFTEEKVNRCTSLFRSIAISPTNDLYACCGLPIRYISYLRLGTAKKHSLKYLYEYQFQDFIKIWLYTEGPKRILDFCTKKRNIEFINTNQWHICQICAEIFRSEENILVLRQNYGEIFSNVMFKYEFLRRKHLKLINESIKS